MTPRVLVCDPVASDGIEVLEKSGVQVDVRTGLSPEELLEAVGGYDALVVRSETKITREVLAKARKLQVVGRAGVGVDNIDVQAATERGVIVVNAPTGNTTSAAEQAVALMLALARHIPEAHGSLKAGRWDRKQFMGVEIRGKTLGIVGLGQVGSEVARRARGLEMKVVAYDPFVPEERAKVLGVELATLENVLKSSDFVSIHTTLSEATRALIGESELKMMKPTARIINTARGGIVDEAALEKALREGWIAGAALDVFSKEPVTDHLLFKLPNVVMTPHLGASTAEAQERVSVDVAEQIIDVLKGKPARYAVNAPLIPAETYAFLAPYLSVAYNVGSLAVQLHQDEVRDVEIEYSGDIAQHDLTPVKAALMGGLLASISEEHVNVVNVDIIAQRRGLTITERRIPSHDIYANLITVRLRITSGETKVSGTLAYDGPHIVRLDDFWVDIPPGEGYLLACENRDRPGMIGAVGTLLGQFDVNISFMNVGRHEKRGTALMVLTLDQPLSSEQLAKVRQIPGILGAKLVHL